MSSKQGGFEVDGEKPEDFKSITLTIPAKYHRVLKIMSMNKGTSMTRIIRKAVMLEVKKYVRQRKAKKAKTRNARTRRKK